MRRRSAPWNQPKVLSAPGLRLAVPAGRNAKHLVHWARSQRGEGRETASCGARRKGPLPFWPPIDDTAESVKVMEESARVIINKGVCSGWQFPVDYPSIQTPEGDIKPNLFSCTHRPFHIAKALSGSTVGA